METWRDSWFEEGTRVLYLYPRDQVDAVLPLSIRPTPASIGRVYVGRVEVLSPWTKDTIRTALSSSDGATLAKFGRFLDPFLQQIRRTSPDVVEPRKTADLLLQAHQRMERIAPNSCVQ